MKTISLFGATGSIGKSACDVILSAKEQFDVQVVTAHQNIETLAQTAIALGADHAVIADENKLRDLENALAGTDIQCHAGGQALIDRASEKVDLSIMAILGFAGLEPIMQAIKQGNTVAIANKEPLVAAGPFVIEEAKKYGTKLLPIDSEHNAVFQVFEEHNKPNIRRIILTASGGPFREHSFEQMKTITCEQALNHPTWEMGAKISVDSATMANKALEVIEAHYLFNLPADKIDVLVHPQSIIHSMVEYDDGSILSQMGASDMRTPLSHVMAWPNRMKTPGQRLDFNSLGKLEFEEPDEERFPLLKLAYDCLKEGQYKNIAFNASNEIAVDCFLKKTLSFLDIMRVVRHITEGAEGRKLDSLENIINYDQDIRHQTQDYIGTLQEAA